MTNTLRCLNFSTALLLCTGCGSLPDWAGLTNQTPLAMGGSIDAGGASSGAGTTSAAGTTTMAMGGAMTSGGGTAAMGGATTSGGDSSGGTVATGGASGGATAQGGSAGGVNQDDLDKAELADALKALDGFVYSSSCKFSNNGSDVSTIAGCNTSDICWQTADLQEFAESKQIPIGGTAGHIYQIDMDVLGVIEPRDYAPAPNCVRLPGQPADTAGIIQCMDGYANKSAVTFNVWEFAIPSPAAKYYFNGVVTHPMHRVDYVDNRFTFEVAAANTIKFTMDDLNGGEIRNCSDKQTTSKYKTAAGKDVVAPSALQQPFNGQWFQLTVLDAKVMR
jgi:hypothetical protein